MPIIQYIYPRPFVQFTQGLVRGVARLLHGRIAQAQGLEGPDFQTDMSDGPGSATG